MKKVHEYVPYVPPTLKPANALKTSIYDADICVSLCGHHAAACMSTVRGRVAQASAIPPQGGIYQPCLE
jgi:hypothetical protein